MLCFFFFFPFGHPFFFPAPKRRVSKSFWGFLFPLAPKTRLYFRPPPFFSPSFFKGGFFFPGAPKFFWLIFFFGAPRVFFPLKSLARFPVFCPGVSLSFLSCSRGFKGLKAPQFLYRFPGYIFRGQSSRIRKSKPADFIS